MHDTTTPGRPPLRLMRSLCLRPRLPRPDRPRRARRRAPALLIGPHGTAKSELLNRVAATLGLAHRHYNASLISFDDLLGYPVPDADHGTIRYLRTPGDLWDAQSVFLDEISRCRPETQNKLFSVVHEKRVQGLALPKLVYRWAAMNPPLTADSDPDDAYAGSLPLDPALADRFAYVVELPALTDLAPEDRIALIARGGESPEAPPDLAALVERTRQATAAADAADRAWTAKYVDALVAPLAEAGLPISGRRAVSLAGGIASVRAAPRAQAVAGAPRLRARDAARRLPAARSAGRAVDGKVTAIHRAAVQLAGEAEGAPMRRLRTLRDPVARVAEGLRLYGEGVDRTELSTLCRRRSPASTPAPLPVRAARAAARRRARRAERAGVRAAGGTRGKGRRDARRRTTRSRPHARRCRGGTSSTSGSPALRAGTPACPARQRLPDAGAGREGGLRRRSPDRARRGVAAPVPAASAGAREAA